MPGRGTRVQHKGAPFLARETGPVSHPLSTMSRVSSAGSPASSHSRSLPPGMRNTARWAQVRTRRASQAGSGDGEAQACAPEGEAGTQAHLSGPQYPLPSRLHHSKASRKQVLMALGETGELASMCRRDLGFQCKGLCSTLSGSPNTSGEARAVRGHRVGSDDSCRLWVPHLGLHLP